MNTQTGNETNEIKTTKIIKQTFQLIANNTSDKRFTCLKMWQRLWPHMVNFRFVVKNYWIKNRMVDLKLRLANRYNNNNNKLIIIISIKYVDSLLGLNDAPYAELLFVSNLF